MQHKFDVTGIIIDHIDSLRDFGNDRYSVSDLSIHFGIPLILSFLVCYFFQQNLATGADIDQLFIGAFSLFAGLMFNLQVLIFGFRDRIDGKIKDISNMHLEAEEKAVFLKEGAEQKRLISETFNNISYCILVSFTIILISIIFTIAIKGTSLASISRFIQFFLIFNFIFTCLMVLKRIRALFRL